MTPDEALRTHRINASSHAAWTRRYEANPAGTGALLSYLQPVPQLGSRRPSGEPTEEEMAATFPPTRASRRAALDAELGQAVAEEQASAGGLTEAEFAALFGPDHPIHERD